MTAAIASERGIAFAMRSSSTVPSRGSVMFCVQAAPTPARAHAQRAATAGDDEEMATPNWPVSAQRPAIESVTSRPLPSAIAGSRQWRRSRPPTPGEPAP